MESLKNLWVLRLIYSNYMIKACFGKSCWWAWRRSIGTSRTTIVEVDRSKIYKNTLVGELNGNATLSKSRLTWIKYGILYVKPKVRLSFARYNDWDCNWYWDVIVHYFLSVKQWKKKKLKLKKKQVNQNIDHHGLVFGKDMWDAFQIWQ